MRLARAEGKKMKMERLNGKIGSRASRTNEVGNADRLAVRGLGRREAACRRAMPTSGSSKKGWALGIGTSKAWWREESEGGGMSMRLCKGVAAQLAYDDATSVGRLPGRDQRPSRKLVEGTGPGPGKKKGCTRQERDEK